MNISLNASMENTRENEDKEREDFFHTACLGVMDSERCRNRQPGIDQHSSAIVRSRPAGGVYVKQVEALTHPRLGGNSSQVRGHALLKENNRRRHS